MPLNEAVGYACNKYQEVHKQMKIHARKQTVLEMINLDHCYEGWLCWLLNIMFCSTLPHFLKLIVSNCLKKCSVCVKPKFCHYQYADFVTKSTTVTDFVVDANHETPRHKSCCWLSWFVLRTFMICVRDNNKVCGWSAPSLSDFVADFPCAL